MKAQSLTKETILNMDAGNRDFPPFRPGDAVRVSERIKEGSKERIQFFEGDVIAMSNNGISSTFTVRRIGANGIAVEKIFPYYSPKIEAVEFIREGKVRRAKLYYMRSRIGKKARVAEKPRTQDQKRKLAKRLAGGQVVEKSPAKPVEAPVKTAQQDSADEKK